MIENPLGTLSKLAGICALLALPASAAPEIHAVLNAASYALPGAPNSGIARGSMFVVFGTELGPADLQQATGFPLPTSLGGTPWMRPWSMSGRHRSQPSCRPAHRRASV